MKVFEDPPAFTIQWTNFVPKQKQSVTKQFTFQATLYKNGDINFVYINVPQRVGDPSLINSFIEHFLQVTTIDDSSYPVKIGLSDAYFLERLTERGLVKNMFTYSDVNLGTYKPDITNRSVIGD